MLKTREEARRVKPLGPRAVEKLALAAWEALPEASSLVFDTDLRYVVARGPALGLHGLTSLNLEGRLAARSFPPDRWKLFEPLYRGALVGETASVEASSLAEGRWCRIQVGPLRGRDGAIVGGVALAVDTTALKQAEQHYRGLLELATDGMVLVDVEGTMRVVNAETVRMFGYEREELVGSSVELLMPERYQRRQVELRTAPDETLCGRRKDGSEFRVELSVTSYESGGVVLFAAVIRDVEAEQQLAESLTLLETLQSSSPVGLLFVDSDSHLQRINDPLARLLGFAAEDQIGRPVAEVVPALWPQLEPAFREIIDGGETILGRNLYVDVPDDPGNVRTLLTSFYPVSVRGETIGIGMAALDITDQRAADEFREAVLGSMGEGLYASDTAGRLTLMNPAASEMLGFSEEELRGKTVHEMIHFQHADGSPYPPEECALNVVRSEGSEFKTSNDAYTRKDGSIFPVAYTASPVSGPSGRNGVVVVFHDTSEEHAETFRAERELDALAWVGRIRDAIGDDRLVLYSQPIMQLTGGAPPREELLLRMIGRSGEIIQPGSFIPIAEKYGLSREIDLWVLEHAIQMAVGGQRVFHVNMSASSIGNLDLLPAIEKLIRKYRPDPSTLVVEVTETALIRNVDAAEAFVHGLASLGLSIALDDFGTGFGSFTNLKRLPVQVLKIDVEFIRTLPSTEANQHLVRAIVLLAKGFGQFTVAEGVEDADTLQLLRDYEVDFAQGFYIGRPAPISAL